jgi:hypothetical protein
MKEEIIKHKGWYVSQLENGRYLLYYDCGIVSETGGLIEINATIYNEAKKEQSELKNIFEKYNLYNFKKVYSVVKGETYSSPVNTPDKFHGQAYIVSHDGGKYYLEYLLAYHGGGSRRFEISKEIFEYARNDEITIKEILKKFNLHHLDDPDNDVN